MKKIISLMLSVSMLICLFSVADFSAYALNSSGKCGMNATYKFNKSTGKLTISGKGEMNNNFADGSSSRFEKNSSIKSVVIENGITDVGIETFSGCKNLKSVSFPKSIRNIYFGAFKNCTKLKTIKLPKSSVYYMGAYAFYNSGYYNDKSNWKNNTLYLADCLIRADDSLSGSYTVKSKTRAIAANAFCDCENLEKVTIPKSVISIGEDAFNNTALFNNKDNWSGKVLYVSNNLVYAERSISGTLKVKSGTRVIASYAFYDDTGETNLKEVKIPSSVRYIGELAFVECNKIKKLTISNGVKYIGKYAFCNCRSLKSLYIPQSVTKIGDYAFKNCGNMTSIKVSGKNKYYDSRKKCNALIHTKTNTLLLGCNKTVIPKGIKTIGTYAFSLSEGLKQIKIPSGVKTIGTEAFGYCFALKSVSIPKSVKTIKKGAFTYCDCLKTVYYASSKKDWKKIKIEKKNSKLTKAKRYYNSKK